MGMQAGIGMDLNPEPGPVPVADVPEPPPLASFASAANRAGETVAEAVAQKTSDGLANMIGDGIAMCLNLLADVGLPPDKKYLAIESAAMARVTRPGTRLVMRRLPVEVQPVGPDGQDMVELFNGVMYCVTAVVANKMVWDAEMRKREAEYAALYDAHYGSGSYQAAYGVSGQQSSARNGGPVPVPPTQRAANGSATVSNGPGYAGNASAAAPGGSNTEQDSGRAANLIHSLYEQHAQRRGQSVNFG